MSSSSGQLFPLASWEEIPLKEADDALISWAHFLGPCNRPFGQQAFGLSTLTSGLITVAVSASTVSVTCAGRARGELVELARLCSAPSHSWATRVALRFWRELSVPVWARQYWPVRAAVSYANTVKGHTGDIYRFDGWKRWGAVRGGRAGGNWSRGKTYDAKTVWIYEYPEDHPVSLMATYEDPIRGPAEE